MAEIASGAVEAHPGRIPQAALPRRDPASGVRKRQVQDAWMGLSVAAAGPSQAQVGPRGSKNRAHGVV